MVLGFIFKEDVLDLCNFKVVDFVFILVVNVEVLVYDLFVDVKEVEYEYGLMVDD